MIDTHTHLYLDEFQPRPADAVERAIAAGVGMMIFPNIDLSTVEPMKRLAAEFPDHIRLAMGLHPSEVGADYQQALSAIIAEARSGYHYVAIGEIGVDLYWDTTFREQQLVAFDEQCRLAVELDLPVIIHCREALDDTLAVLAGLPVKPRGVMHSFGGSTDDVERIRAVVPDFYFGINGIVTFKNSRLREALPAIGIDRLLLETDAPYLAPVPMRGRRNESAYVIHTAAHIADSLHVTLRDVEEATDANARRLFSL